MKSNWKRFHFLFFTSLLIFIQKTSFAQDYIAHIQKIGAKEGLSSYNIDNFLQSSDGRLWFNTDYGLNCYDGTSIRNYTKEENGICHNNILGFLEDHNGMFWITSGNLGSNHCYTVFDPQKEQAYSVEEYLGSSPPFDLIHTNVYPLFNDAILFIEKKPGSSFSQIYEYDGKRIKPIFKIDQSDKVWANKHLEGLNKISATKYAVFLRSMIALEESIMLIFNQEGNFEHYRCPKEHPVMLLTRTVYDNYCTYCVNRDDPHNWFFSFEVDWQQQQTQDIKIKNDWQERFVNSKGKTYVVNSDSIKIYDRSGTLEAKAYLGLSLTSIYFDHLFVDNDENIWFNDQEFLYCISLVKPHFKVGLFNPSHPNRFRGIAANKNQELFANQSNWIVHKTATTEWSPTKIAGVYLGSFIQDSILWLGSETPTLFKYNLNNQSFQRFTPRAYQDKTFPAHIWIPYIAPDGRVWAGTNKGIHRLDEKIDSLLPFNQGILSELSKSIVYAFHSNENGTWLSTSNGLFLVDLKKERILAHYNSKQSDKQFFLPTDHVAHLHEDNSGIFWLATKGNGLIKWNPQTKQYKQYTQKGAGLSHNVLYSVYGDDYGNLWMSSQRGLIRFHKESEATNIYLKEDGLPHNEFNTISHFQASDGRLYFGGQNGLIHFHPKDFEADQKKHPFIITNYNKQILATDSLMTLTYDFLENPQIILQPEDKAALLEFAFLDYNNSQNHIYSHRIIGYDKNWTYQTDNQLKISGLPYGNYELKLRAKALRSSAWTNYPQGIKIQVLRPFYLQNWFILSAIACLIGFIYGLVRWRIRKLEQGKLELEQIVQERTEKIERDKTLIQEQAEELKALDKLKTRFFANISHELRTPLTLILGPLSYILDHPDAWEKRNVKEQLLIMQRNGKSLMQLIEEILDLSKLEANKLELQEEPTSIHQFFEYIFAVFEPQFQAQKLDYELILMLRDKNLTALLDRKKIEKVINNFLSNAIKFTPQNGKITLSVQEKDKHFIVRVSDTGKGVHPNDLPYIFERFYQSKQADQKLYGGTGIGLALVNDFAKLMNGKVYVESTLGEGSNFYFEIPQKTIDTENIHSYTFNQEKIEAELIDSIGYDFTILVVEDNKDMRDFICLLLKKKYKTILSAHNGLEGLQLLKEHNTKINLIVSDIMMPEVDGLTMLKEIKSHTIWKEIPVIMLTALAAERDKLTALTIGVDDYLTKPFSVNELLIRTQNLLYNYHQRIESKNEDAEIVETTALDDIWINEVEQNVKNSIRTKVLDVEGLANEMFISTRQLTRKLKAITGLTPSKFIREVQLQGARKELETGTALSITAVTFNHGFNQVSTFSKLFKKRFGKNPSEYLATNKK